MLPRWWLLNLRQPRVSLLKANGFMYTHNCKKFCGFRWRTSFNWGAYFPDEAVQIKWGGDLTMNKDRATIYYSKKPQSIHIAAGIYLYRNIIDIFSASQIIIITYINILINTFSNRIWHQTELIHVNQLERGSQASSHEISATNRTTASFLACDELLEIHNTLRMKYMWAAK